MTETIDSLGISTTTEYLDGRVAFTTDGNGATTSYTYDVAGRLKSLTDPKSNTTTWLYNWQGLPTSETTASGSRHFEYDAAGNLTRRTDRNGNSIVYTYDRLSQMVKEDWEDDPDGRTFYYVYSGGHLKNAIETDGTLGAGGLPDLTGIKNQVSFNYDQWGRQTADIQQWDTITSKLASVFYEYSGANWSPSVSNVSYASSSTLQSKTMYEYDKRGDVASIKQQTPSPFSGSLSTSTYNEKTVSYQRDILGRVTEISRSMKVGSASPTNGPGSGFGYDSAGRLSLIAHVDGTGYIASYGYTYDADSRITQINSLADGVINYT